MNATQGIGAYFDKLKGTARELKRALAHAVFNGTMQLAQGGKFEHGFMSGFVSSLAGSSMANSPNMKIAEKIALSAVIGGTAEKLGGGKFANGAVTGAYVMMFNHAMHQEQDLELQYPPAVDLQSDNWDEQLFAWIKFIEENDLRGISIGRIIDFNSVKAGIKKYGARYYGSKEYADGYIEWNTLGLPLLKDRRITSGVSPVALSDGKGGYTDFSFIFEGYQISGNSPPVNLFQIKFNNYATFEKAFHSIYGKETSPWWIEGR